MWQKRGKRQRLSFGNRRYSSPGLIMRDGKKRILCDAGLSTETLLDGFEDYLRTPVLERIRLKKVIERTELRAVDALLSGVSALSYMSDLAHEDSAPTIALEKYQLEALKEHMGDRWLEAQWYEPAAVVIEGSGRIPWTRRPILVLTRRVFAVCRPVFLIRCLRKSRLQRRSSARRGRTAQEDDMSKVGNRAICRCHERL